MEDGSGSCIPSTFSMPNGCNKVSSKLNTLTVISWYADNGAYFHFNKVDLDQLLGRENWHNEVHSVYVFST